jgi:hypothetical protein
VTCRRVRRELPGYVEGSAGLRLAARVAGHLADCPQCRRQHSLVVVLAEAMRLLPAVHCSPTFASTVLTRARAAEVPAALRPRVWGLRLAAAGVAAVVAATILVLPQLRQMVRARSPGPAVVSLREGEEFVLPVAAPEEMLASTEFDSWPPAQGRVRVSFVLDQNMAPMVSTENVYVLDHARGWSVSRQAAF